MVPEKKTYDISVVKNSGESALFDPEKILRSLKNVGASDEVAEMIVRAGVLVAYAGIRTREIYRMTFSLLRTFSRGASV